MPYSPRKLGCLTLVFVTIVILAWGAAYVLPRSRYGYASRRINDKIFALHERRPPDVSQELWENGVAWASIAHGNICAYEELTPYQSMLQFEQELDAKLTGEINLDTLKWIGERAAATCPNGERYMLKHQWRERWDAMLRDAGK